MLSQHQLYSKIKKHKKPSFYKLLKVLNQNFNIALFQEQFCELGKGSFGRCYLGKILLHQQHQEVEWQFDQLVNHDRIVAIKVIAKESHKCSSEKYEKEVSILAQLQKQTKSENILKVFDFRYETQRHYYIVMEYCNNCTLYDLIQSRRSNRLKFTLLQFIQIFLDLINGYAVLKRKDILHFDLKPQNIFIKNKIFKIGDFGLAMKLNNQNIKKVQIGTWIYASPEQLRATNQIQIDHKSDLYALGLILYEVMFGRHPYFEQKCYSEFIKLRYQYYKQKQSLSEHSIKKRINLQYLAVRKDVEHPKVNIEFDAKHNKAIVDELRRIVIKMCSLDRDYRPSLFEITQSLSKLTFQKTIDREKLFPGLQRLSKSYVTFQMDKMTKYAISIAEANPINESPNIKQTQKHTISTIFHMKTRIEITLEFLLTLHKLRTIIRQYLLANNQRLLQFEECFYNYCYSINMREYRRSLEQWSLMNKEQQRIATRQQIQLLMTEMRSNDAQFQQYATLQIYSQSEHYHDSLLNNIRSQLQDSGIIRSDNIYQVAAFVVLSIFVQMKRDEEDERTNLSLRSKMVENERVVQMITQYSQGECVFVELVKLVQKYMDENKIVFVNEIQLK